MKNKKVIVGIMILVLGLGCLGGYFFYQKQQKQALYDSITLQFQQPKVIEYGSQIDPQTFIKKASGEVTLPTLDTFKIGKQELVYKVTKDNLTKEFSYEVEVKDTQAPVITLKKNKDSIMLNDSCDIKDYIKSITDPVDGKLNYQASINEEDVSYYTYKNTVNTKKVGTYQVQIIAVDKNKNQTKKDLTIAVLKEETKTPSQTTSKKDTTTQTTQQNVSVSKNKIICIDPGHQASGMSAKEAIGPGSSIMKAKVTTGATGVVSKIRESQINLEIALKLRQELQSRGYKVVMTRTSQNVRLSNQQRAKIGNNAHAGAVIHLHCDSIGNSSVRGAHTIAIAKNNPYCPGLYKASSSLATNVIRSYTQATGIKNRGVSYRNDLTGLNWSKVPSIYIEMGFISNPSEDRNLTNSAFQRKCAKGIANGIDHYFH